MVWSGVTNIVKLHKSGRETNYMYTDIFMNDITVKNCKYAVVYSGNTDSPDILDFYEKIPHESDFCLRV